MRLLVFGTYESDYSRNRVLLNALDLQRIDRAIVHAPLTQRTRNKTGRALGPLAVVGWALRWAATLPRLVFGFFAAGRRDAILILYPGQWDVVLAWALERLRRPWAPAPIVYSPLVSLYDTLVHDRGQWKPKSFRARLAYGLDRLACRLSRKVILDTEAHANYFAETFRLAPEKVASIPVGAEEAIFHPEKEPEAQPRANRMTVLFYGKVSPLHGDGIIAEAIERLGGDQRFFFILVGTGQRSEEMKRRLQPLPNAEWHDWIEYEWLGDAVRRADVVLGVFGAGAKSQRVIPNKIHQAAACGKAIVTGQTETLREVFRPDSLLEIPRDSADALVESLEKLHGDSALRQRLGENALADFKEKASTERVGEMLGEGILNV